MVRRLLVVGVATLIAASCTGHSSDSPIAGGRPTPTTGHPPRAAHPEPASCQPDQVRLRTGGVSRPPPGRLMVIGFKLENRSGSACNGAGYPSVVLQQTGHLAFRLHPERGGRVEFGDPRAVRQLTLAPGEEANFTIQMRPQGPRCLLANRAKVRRTTSWSYLTTDHRTVRVCLPQLREAAVYPPAFLASLD
jgi:Protein of unknown function (DUF4232)